MVNRIRFPFLLLIVLSIASCQKFCPSGGKTTLPPGALPPNLGSAPVSVTVTGVSSGISGEHEIKTSAKITNSTGSDITWTTDGTQSGTDPISGATVTGSAQKLAKDKDTDPQKYKITITGTDGKNTITISGEITTNDNPPPPYTGSGTWTVTPTAGGSPLATGTWSVP